MSNNTKNVIAAVTLVIVLISVGIMISSQMDLNNIKEGNMKLTTVFPDGGQIPSEYTCDGKDLAPVLNISDVPANAKNLALIVDDPDAPMGTWVHWVLYNIPADTKTIDDSNLPKEAKSGITDFGRTGWGGPCPPSGSHRYFFKLYALDKSTDLPAGLTKDQLTKEIKDSVIEKAQVMGLYKRNK